MKIALGQFATDDRTGDHKQANPNGSFVSGRANRFAGIVFRYSDPNGLSSECVIGETCDQIS
jgi:hypothetical protein